MHFVTSSGQYPQELPPWAGKAGLAGKWRKQQEFKQCSPLGLLVEVWEMDIPQTRVISRLTRGCHTDQPRGTCGLWKEGGGHCCPALPRESIQSSPGSAHSWQGLSVTSQPHDSPCVSSMALMPNFFPGSPIHRTLEHWTKSQVHIAPPPIWLLLVLLSSSALSGKRGSLREDRDLQHEQGWLLQGDPASFGILFYLGEVSSCRPGALVYCCSTRKEYTTRNSKFLLTSVKGRYCHYRQN